MTEGALRDRAGDLATLVVTRWVLVRRPSVSFPGPDPRAPTGSLGRPAFTASWLSRRCAGGVNGSRPWLPGCVGEPSSEPTARTPTLPPPNSPALSGASLHSQLVFDDSASFQRFLSLSASERDFLSPPGGGVALGFTTRNQRPPSFHL